LQQPGAGTEAGVGWSENSVLPQDRRRHKRNWRLLSQRLHARSLLVIIEEASAADLTSSENQSEARMICGLNQALITSP
jgi:hypothetical protein